MSELGPSGVVFAGAGFRLFGLVLRAVQNIVSGERGLQFGMRGRGGDAMDEGDDPGSTV